MKGAPMRLAPLVQLWFAADVLLALWPQFHWLMRGFDPVLGLPLALVYAYGAGVFIALSIVVAYLSQHKTRGAAD